MPHNENSGSIAEAIFNTLKYFGIFRYPLLPAEIHRFLPVQCTPDVTFASLEALVKTGRVVCSPDGFYSVDGQEGWASNRKAGNDRAMRLLAKSLRSTRIISAFPFVDAIAISGSLSKYYAGEDADIDYFIITQKNRLWVARTLLHLFKKLTFIPGYQHFFCMNYFIDTDALVMADQNIYTAIELATLIPVFNPDRITGMQEFNSWFREYLPNEPLHPDRAYLVTPGKPWLTRFTEWLLNRLSPGKLNLFLMKLTDRKWRKKWRRKGFPMEDYDRAFHTSLHVSKNHPADFQKRILNALETGSGVAGGGV